MLRLDETLHGRCLGDLLEVRKSLRRQEILLQGATEDLRGELSAWRWHWKTRVDNDRPVAPELAAVWTDLAEKEVELGRDLVQVRHALYAVNREIDHLLRRPRTVAG